MNRFLTTALPCLATASLQATPFSRVAGMMASAC
jgi:hypothetical protein